MIVEAIGVYGERVEQALVGIRRLRPFVDRAVVIVDETVTDQQKKALTAAGCEVYFHPWTDSMVNMRNQYLKKVQTDDWVIVHDPDEHFNERFCNDVKSILPTAEEQGIDLLLINSHDSDIDKDGKRQERISDFFKNLIYRKREGTHYEGVGEVKEVHETLIIPGTMKQVRLDPKKYWYTHEKYWWEVWERAARNVFMAGGGNNAGSRNPSWKPLREICESIGLTDWTKIRDYFRKGNIDPRLKKWLWDNRSEGFDYDHEEMEFGRWYFEYLRPEEAEGWKPITEIPQGHPAEVMRFVEDCYMKVLGRHADQPGKEAYTQAILEGNLRREDLPDVLKRSLEYQEKVGEVESVKVKVPINVDVRMSESIILDALRRSKTYWEIVKPKLDIGTFIKESLGDEEWRDFLVWFYKTEPTFHQFIAKLRTLEKK